MFFGRKQKRPKHNTSLKNPFFNYCSLSANWHSLSKQHPCISVNLFIELYFTDFYKKQDIFMGRITKFFACNLIKKQFKINLFLGISIGFCLISAKSYSQFDALRNDMYRNGVVGTLYNSFPYMIEKATTSYYGRQNLYGMVFLPFVINEYDGSVVPMPFIPPYTTGIALCTIKAPALGIYASNEVVGLFEDPETNRFIVAPFASIIPANANFLHYNGPFNTMAHLNKRPEPWFYNPLESELGVSVLEGIQKFSAFTHELFNWNGFDKAGNTCISAVLSRELPTGFSTQKKIISLNNYSYIHPDVSRDIIGHEISHGIILESLGPPPSGDDIIDDPIIPNPMMHPEMDALAESFCDIMGLSMDNWYGPGKFDEPNWRIGFHQGNDIFNKALRPFDIPKMRKFPNTYMGRYYRFPDRPDYDPHANAEIMNYWFYLLNSIKSGTVDDSWNDDDLYSTTPLIPGDKEATYKLALQLVFKTFTEKLTYQSKFHDVRAATLEVIQELGYPIGSHVYQQVMNAWYAVGVGKKWDPNTNNPNCDAPNTGLSWFNGKVNFKTLKTTIGQDPASGPFFSLKNCADQPGIQTKQFNPNTREAELAIDADGDQIFHPENNTDISKSSVGVHWATEYTNNWFKKYLDHIGPLGDGSIQIHNILGDPGHSKAVFDIPSRTYFYPYTPDASDLDAVVQTYFSGINHFLKGDQNINQDYANPEWEALKTGIAQIMALNVKNQYQTGIPYVKPQIWTLGENIPNNPQVLDFAHPEYASMPKLYQGQNWDLAYPSRNASLINFWYYLLVNGTNEANGYRNEKGNTYFVFPIANDLALKIIWKAYGLIPLHGTFEEFRLATHQVLHSLGYDQKSKEYIALHDAWAAVMNLPDYAASLKTNPENGQVIYPWSAKLGIEVEYPLYESSRVFEVSESPKFDDQVALVYRFLNYSSPDLNNGMSFGRLNLQPGKTYYWRSHLFESGNRNIGVGGNCDSSPDPAFCLSLKNKQKWTSTFTFNTAAVAAPQDLIPAEGSIAKAWKTPFQWNAVLGADSYLLNISDQSGIVPAQEIQLTRPYDEDEAIVYHELALGKDKSYNWKVVGKAKTGSEEGVKRIENPLFGIFDYIMLNEGEKAQLPDALGDISGPIIFRTDIPKITLGIPADFTRVPMLGTLQISATSEEPRADRYLSRFFLNGDFQDPEWRNYHPHPSILDIKLSASDYLEDGHTYGWTFVPIKDPVPPFIPSIEEGETPSPFHIVVDKNLIPKPRIIPLSCVEIGKPVVLRWEPTEGASFYQYSIKKLSNQQIVAFGETQELKSPPIIQVSEPFNTYEWQLSAGVKDRNNNLVFGPAASDTYDIHLQKPENLIPAHQNVVLGTNRSVNLSWDALPGISDYRFSLYKKVGLNSYESIIENKTTIGNSVYIENLEYESIYQWYVAGIGANPDCVNPSKAEFNTQKSPSRYDLGFTLYVQDLVGPNKQSIPGSFSYVVELFRPDGTLEFRNLINANDPLQVGFSPGNPSQLIGGLLNGQVLDQDGDYLVRLTIQSVFSGLTDPWAEPEVLFKAQEYVKEAGQNWKLNEEIRPDPPQIYFPGRVVGSSVHLKFHYEKPN